MVLKCGPSSSRTRGSSDGSDVRRGLVSFMRLILTPVDGDGAAERGDRLLGELVVGDLIEGQFLVGRDVADIDVVLVGPFGTFAYEPGIDRRDAVLRQNPDGELDRLARVLGRLHDRRNGFVGIAV